MNSLFLLLVLLFAGCASRAPSGNETAPIVTAITRAEGSIRAIGSDNKRVRALSAGIGRDSKAIVRGLEGIRLSNGVIDDKAVKALKIIGDWKRRHPHTISP